MFKRLIWVGIGVGVGVVIAAKAQSYVRAHTPDGPRQFVLGPDEDHVAVRTLKSLLDEFNQARRSREADLNRRFTESRS